MASSTLVEPDLAKCFAGEQHLFTWQAAAEALSDSSGASSNHALRAFLEAGATIQILGRPWSPFPAPSAQEKQKFEAATAPISITPSPTLRYNLNEIKDDALWLSQQAQISEYEALRLVVQEWQCRPAHDLLEKLTDEESVSIQEATGCSQLAVTRFALNASALARFTRDPTTGTELDASDIRRVRLFEFYYSACASILRVSQLVVVWGCRKQLRASATAASRIQNSVPWLEELGHAAIARQTEKEGASIAAAGFDKCVRALKSSLDSLDQGQNWHASEDAQPALTAIWITGLSARILQTLHLAFLHIDVVVSGYLPATSIEQWFSTLAQAGFLRSFPMITEQQQALIPVMQGLVSLVSMAVLKVNQVFDDLDSNAYSTWDTSHYLLDGAMLERLSGYLLSAIDSDVSPATPAAFSWSVLTSRLAAYGQMLEVERERLIESDPDSRQPVPNPSSLEEASTVLRTVDEEGKPIYQELAEVCSSQGVLRVSAQLLAASRAGFATKVDKISSDRFRFQYTYLLRVALGAGILEYSPDVIVLAHAILEGNDPTSSIGGVRESDSVVAFFTADEAVLRPALLEEARIRYPYELVPFLKLYGALARWGGSDTDGLPNILDQVTHMSIFMQRLPTGFVEYHLEHEEDNVNQVALSVDLPQFVSTETAKAFPRNKLLQSNGRVTTPQFQSIQAGTRGTIVDDRQQPFVAAWMFPHSAVDYLVPLLATYAVASDRVESSTMQPITTDEAAETMAFLVNLLQVPLVSEPEDGAANQYPAELLLALDMSTEHRQDTISIVLAIFDQELLRLCQSPGNEMSLELLVHCGRFVQILVKIAPNRVWPWLARSRLLETDASESSLATILIGTELVLGRYDFLLSCIGIYRNLIDDALDHSVSRTTSDRSLTRFGNISNVSSGTSAKTMTNVLSTFTRALISIFESSIDWKYCRPDDQLSINLTICETFTNILRSSYGADDSFDLSRKLCRLIAPAAEYIVGVYLAPGSDNKSTSPVLSSLLAGLEPLQISVQTQSSALCELQVRAAIEFVDILIRAAIFLHAPCSHLEQQLFKATPLLIRLYASGHRFKASLLQLLESMVQSSVRARDVEGSGSVGNKALTGNRESPSLLGYLGTASAQNFLTLLSSLDGALQDDLVLEHTWNMLSSILTCDQRWFSLYLLTGSTPRQRMTDKAGSIQGGKDHAVLTRMLDRLASMHLETDDAPWSLLTAMIKFVVAAYNKWSWAIASLSEHKDFLQRVLSFLGWLGKQPRDLRTDAAVLLRTYQNVFASHIAELLAMLLHDVRHDKDSNVLKDVLARVQYFEDSALQIPSYNYSLHSILKRNIEQKFPAVSLSNFKRTTLLPSRPGPDFFYDLQLADRLLAFDSNWTGPRQGQGFRGEVVKANLNLSLVDSELRMLETWKLLLVELSAHASTNARIQQLIIQTAADCMEVNAQSSTSEALFAQIVVTRVDMAYTLLKKMAATKNTSLEARQLLGSVWKALRAATPDFDSAFSSESADYYRALLRVMYLVLQFHQLDESDKDESQALSFRSSFRGGVPQSRKDIVEPVSDTLLQILADVVVKGFRSLATQLHEQPDSVQPSDFALLTALLQRVLAIPEMARWQQQAALLFANSSTMRYAASLFSWSDKLTISTNGVDDPIYGELSLLFILTLSSLPSLAETMAVEGVLSQLNTANLMQYYQRPNGMGPFDSPARLHSVWAKGILPLCLNLLFSVGAPIAGEIASFLNQYSHQLARSSVALKSKNADKLTLAVASETHSLALLWSIIDDMRRQGPKLGIHAADVPPLDWDAAAVKEDVEGWLARKAALRERIVTDGSSGVEDKVVKELEAAGACLGLHGV